MLLGIVRLVGLHKLEKHWSLRKQSVQTENYKMRLLTAMALRTKPGRIRSPWQDPKNFSVEDGMSTTRIYAKDDKTCPV